MRIWGLGAKKNKKSRSCAKMRASPLHSAFGWLPACRCKVYGEGVKRKLRLFRMAFFFWVSVVVLFSSTSTEGRGKGDTCSGYCALPARETLLPAASGRHRLCLVSSDLCRAEQAQAAAGIGAAARGAVPARIEEEALQAAAVVETDGLAPRRAPSHQLPHGEDRAFLRRR